MIISRVVLAAALFVASASVAPAQTLKFRFIGNAAYEITDGETTLITDFPYKSGALGYMAYSREEIRPRTDALCLYTHSHDDHYSGVSLKKIGCTVMGPKNLTSSRMLPKVPVLPLADEVTFRSLKIVPIATPHAELEHYSYAVTWHGLKLYFTGDTESVRDVSQAEGVDVLFITPWLVKDLLTSKKEPLAGKVVVYHQEPGESAAACSTCTVPSQGEVFDVPWK